MQKIRFQEGERIFSEGDQSIYCYKIISGKVEIVLNIPGDQDPGQTHAIATCGAGEIIGEMGVIEQCVRSASAVAIEPTLCKSYTLDEIVSLLSDDPREALAYVRTLIRRIRESNRRMSW
jgi:CRP/FNR family cyclic AMP-dependent transcriptional regulator